MCVCMYVCYVQMFMNRLMELIATDPLSRVVYEKRELALESIIQVPLGTPRYVCVCMCVSTPTDTESAASGVSPVWSAICT